MLLVATHVQDGDDLHLRVHITLLEALLGVDKTIAHLDKHQVRIKKDGITRPGNTRRFELAMCWGREVRWYRVGWGGTGRAAFMGFTLGVCVCVCVCVCLCCCGRGESCVHRGSHDHS